MADQPYVYQPFPKMRYRADGATKIVNSQEELDALSEDWGGPEVVAPAEETPAPDIQGEDSADPVVEPGAPAAPRKRGKKAQ